MGLAAVPLLFRRVSSRAEKPAPARGGDVVSRLERANRLRAEGALTAAEFEKLKAEILGGER
jgi:hypothetical protein